MQILKFDFGDKYVRSFVKEHFIFFMFCLFSLDKAERSFIIVSSSG